MNVSPEHKLILENQTTMMGALSILLLHLTGRDYHELQRSRLRDAIAATRNATEAPEVFVSPEKRTTVTTSGDLFEGCDMGAPLHEVAALIARTHELQSGALAEANANREHLRQQLRAELTPAEALAIINANREPGPVVTDTARQRLEAAIIREGYQPDEARIMADALHGPRKLSDYNAKVSTAASDKP